MDRRDGTTRGGGDGAADPVEETTPQPHDGLPPLAALRDFEAVVRVGSMRRAAAELGVGHAVLSRRIRRLEDWFRTRLVESGPRGVRPTEEGRRLASAVAIAFDTIATAVADLRPSRDRRTIRLWCVPGIAARWLAPRLADLQAALPGCDIVIRATTERPDFLHREADVEIRYAQERPSDAASMLLERSRLIPVAAPALLARSAPLADLADIPRLGLLHEESRDQWRRWFAAVGAKPAGGLDGPRLWYASSALDAAVAGQGVALATRLQAADDLAAGRLVEIAATDVRLGDYWVVASPGRWSDPTLVRLRAWLAAAVTATAGGRAPGDDGAAGTPPAPLGPTSPDPTPLDSTSLGSKSLGPKSLGPKSIGT